MEGADDDMDLLTGFSVFTGGGGLDIAAEAAGIKTVGRCEWDRYAQAVLMSRIRSRQLHDAPLWHDIASLDGRPWRGLVDCMFGGFPCQDVSFAGKRRAKKTLVEGSRSGYWSHFARLIREMEPGGVLVENVPGLLTGGLGDVLRDLAALGYDARWQVLSAAAVGAPHLRDRVFVVALTGLPLAHAQRRGWPHGSLLVDPAEGRFDALRHLGAAREEVADAEGQRERARLREDESRRLGRGRLGDGSGERATGLCEFCADELDGAILRGDALEHGDLCASCQAAYPDADRWRRAQFGEPEHAGEQGPLGDEPDGLREEGRREGTDGPAQGGVPNAERDALRLERERDWEQCGLARPAEPGHDGQAWLVAHADGVGRGEGSGDLSGGERQPVRGSQEGAGDVPDATDGGRPVRGGPSGQGRHPLRENLQAEAGPVLSEAAPRRSGEGQEDGRVEIDERLLGEGLGLREGARNHAGHALAGPALADADGLGQQERVLEGGIREGEPSAEEAAPGRGEMGDTERGRRGRKSRRRAGAEPADGHARVPGGDGDGRPAQPGLGGALDGMGAGLDDARRAGGEVVRGDGEERALLEARLHPWGEGWEEGVPRVAKKVPYRVDRLRITGNGVVWQCAYPFFQEIAEVIIGARE